MRAWKLVTEMDGPRLSVLLAVIAIHAQAGRMTVREVAEAVERNLSTTHAHLRWLRKHGWVTWEGGKAGTLRPLVKMVQPTREEAHA